MKKFSIRLALITMAALTSTSALAEDLKFVYADGEAKVEKYKYHFFYDPMTRLPIPRENEEPKARQRARDLARKNAKKLFEETCRNSKNGIPSRVTAINLALPDEPESKSCEDIDWESEDEGKITCHARARGTCTVKENKDPRVVENTTAPARIETVNGASFLIDAEGVAHPIAGAGNAN